MASGYVGAVRERQSRGPYFLGGWSLGAVVAYEMPQQLRAAGEDVALLAMIDEGPPAGVPPDLVRDDVDAVASLFPAPQSGRVRELLDGSETLRLLGPDERLLHIRERLAAAGLIPADAPIDRFRRLHQGFRARKLGISRYVARRYDSPLTLFRAADREDPPAAADDAYGWRQLCERPVQVVDVPGSHDTVVTEPNVRVLAAELQRCIHESRGAVPSSDVVRW